MYVLDTDTLTHLQHRHPRLLQRIAALEPSEATATTVVSRIEALRGRFDALLKAASTDDLLRAQERLTVTERFLNEVTTLEVDDAAADHFFRMNADRRLRKIGRRDLLIASIALARRATLVTRNLRHFQLVPGLMVINWVD